jgi:histidinol-phosphate phosphatase family protein
VVVSNQSVVARGWLDERGLRGMDRRLRALVREGGARIDGTYYCPHHPRYSGACSCRKPKPGLILRALRELGLDPRRCFLIGDTARDMAAGRRARLRTVLVLTGYGRRERESVIRRRLADKVARNVAGAARWILDRRERETRGRG